MAVALPEDESEWFDANNTEGDVEDQDINFEEHVINKV